MWERGDPSPIVFNVVSVIGQQDALTTGRPIDVVLDAETVEDDATSH